MQVVLIVKQATEIPGVNSDKERPSALEEVEKEQYGLPYL